MQSPILLCLHGWGGSSESFNELRDALDNSDLKILTPDLPGFGNEPEPDHPFSVDDFASWTEQWLGRKLNELSIVNCQLSIVGHSFGGRIAIKLATRGNLKIDHLFLCASAGIKRPKHIKRVISLSIAKTGNAILSIPGLRILKNTARSLLYKALRVHDYEQASALMQKTLVKVTKEDLKPYLKEIKIPTDIFWGENDKMTPIADAHIMKKEIEGSTLHTFPDVGHRIHRDKADNIAEVILSKIG
ncbi:MAG: alpha/beta hydrolase [Candidatus Peribacteraceae bacterium]|jgi:pimeloyl-ACP methyl ester carboxylesterase|nr:alpha/beta hydrolase [Candidatus Peribacteraceae bacterium]|tara:strand:- start:432 stop:1166 length:735 start_codon:yes stop_codon:yes gene_type:complete